jgi:hypothetical protein
MKTVRGDIAMTLPAVRSRVRVALAALCIGATLSVAGITSVVRDDPVLAAVTSSEPAPSIHPVRLAGTMPGGGI